MAGGGPQPRPGEITLAHAGVLFLDEIPHFKPSVLDLLREPLANGRIVLARARYRSEFPAAFQLVAAMNPCPAGRICSRDSCRCAPARVRTYQGRISGPLLDRIDLQIYVPPVPSADLLAAQPEGGPNHVSARRSVAQARARQHQRQGCLNADLPGAVLVTRLDTPTRTLLTRAADKLALSARSLHKILRVARTIADLKGCEAVRSAELTEALGYRNLDWEGGLGCSPQ
jgi:magnesium chelatase family protein